MDIRNHPVDPTSNKTIGETLGAESIFSVDLTAWNALQALLDRPIQYKPGLIKLLREPGVLD